MAEILHSTPQENAQLAIPILKDIRNFDKSEITLHPENPLTTSLRTIVIGMGPIGEGVVQGLIDRGHEVVAVGGPMKKKSDKDFDPVRKLAKEQGIEDFTFSDFEDKNFLPALKNYKADLIVGANFTPTVGIEQIKSARLGMAAIHLTPLPLHPGGSAVARLIMSGNTNERNKFRTGATFYRIEDDGKDPKLMDSGHVIARNFTEIDDTHTNTTAVGEMVGVAIATTLEGVDTIASAYRLGKLYVGQEQNNRTDAEPRVTKEEVQLHLGTAHEIYHITKGASNRPGAWVPNPTSEGWLNVFDPEKIQGPVEVGKAGRIVDTTDGITVAATQGLVKFGTAQEASMQIIEGITREVKGKLTPANEIAEKMGWENGLQLLSIDKSQPVI